MSFTDIFIRRPVLATVVSLLILLLGAQAIMQLPIRQYPEIRSTAITITTAYPGASADLIQGFITTPIEQAIASAEGLDYTTSQSQLGISTVTAHMRLNADPNAALTEIMSKVAEVRGVLPPDAEDPVIQKGTGQDVAIMYLGFASDRMTPEQVTDYMSRVIQPRLATLDGVAAAEILGGQTFAMRVWLNPQSMAALDVTTTDVVDALRANNFQAAPGRTEGYFVTFNINAATDLQSVEEFQNLVIRAEGNTLIRLGEVADVELGTQDPNSRVTFNGQLAVFMAIEPTPSANPLSVIDGVRRAFPDIQRQLPAGLEATIIYDATTFIRNSIREVITTIAEAAVIVVVVIFLFLGSVRSVAIPMVTIPLSLVGTCFLLLAMGFSLNLLTLLAMVLAIGLVVDDAIVVLENIHRHLEEGKTPSQAALTGAREIVGPVISMTITLAAVYAPIAFMGGLTGALFQEFALALAGAVVISGIVALTLSPMMASRLLTANVSQGRFVRFIDRVFDRVRRRYDRSLHGVLRYRPVVVMVAVVMMASCAYLYLMTPQELAPEEDQGAVFIAATAPQYANLDYMNAFVDQFDGIFSGLSETDTFFAVNGLGGLNQNFSGVILRPWDERERTQAEIQQVLQEELSRVTGLQAFAFGLPSLPGGGEGLPVQFVISTTADFRLLYQVVDQLVGAARQSGLFIVVDNDLRFDNPAVDLTVNRSLAAELGISMSDIAQTLSSMMGGNYVNRFEAQGRSYQVIPQVPRQFRLDPELVSQFYVRTAGGGLVPLSSVVSISTSVGPNALTHYNQLNSATISAVMMPGLTIGQGLDFLRERAETVLPQGFSYDYTGQSRQYVQEGAALVYTFGFAVIVIFLVLAAQFESFRDPLIILICVPMSVFGALVPLNLGLASINIFTQVGLVTLIGLITKHGILMVEFANRAQEDRGLDRRAAIEEAAGIRLRPILMTTAATVVGVIPLILATGAGAASRFNIGLVIAAGMSIGTLFTLYVVPTFYTYLARDRRRPAADSTQPEEVAPLPAIQVGKQPEMV